MSSPDAAAILEAARGEGVMLTLREAGLDQSGVDFVVAHAVDDRGAPWIVRAPRRADVLARAESERRALDLVGPRLPVAVPEWRVFSERVIAYPKLPGDPAAVVDMAAGGYRWRFDAADPPRAFVESLGDALAALHSIDPADAVAAGLPVEEPAREREAYAARMESAREELEVPDGLWRRWRDWLADEALWPAHGALVHGDLHPPHVLVDGQHRVVGLLDWTEAHVADPAIDFALLYAAMGRAALDALLERYGSRGGRVWPRMREQVVARWLAYPVVIAEFARTTGEEGPMQLARALVAAAAREVESGES